MSLLVSTDIACDYVYPAGPTHRCLAWVEGESVGYRTWARRARATAVARGWKRRRGPCGQYDLCPEHADVDLAAMGAQA